MVFAKAKAVLRRKAKPAAAGAILKTPEARSGHVRLSWVWTTEKHPHANLGDALSAVVVSAMSGLNVARASFGDTNERIAAVGTIGHAQHGGKIHLWGTGFDLKRDRHGVVGSYHLPAETQLIVHGVRGRQTAEGLRKLGLQVPDVFGDPVWFLPRIFPCTSVKKEYELGIIVHISELDEATAEATVRANLTRYKIPPSMAGSVRIINTYTPATVEGLRGKVEEIVSCRRILSTSLHGLVIAEAYGIPCAWFATYKGASGLLSLNGTQPIDHRMIDFYGGAGRDHVLSYLQPLHATTDWEQATRFIDTHWQPLDYTGAELFEAFPLKRIVRFKDNHWRTPVGLLERNPY